MRWRLALGLITLILVVRFDGSFGAQIGNWKPVNPPADWSYQIPHRMVPENKGPVQIELLEDLGPLRKPDCRQVKVRPYVLSEKTKNYLVKLRGWGHYYPRSGRDLYWAEQDGKNNKLIEFPVIVCAQGLTRVVHIELVEQPALQSGVVSGHVASLKYRAQVETQNGTQQLETPTAEVQWVRNVHSQTIGLAIVAQASTPSPKPQSAPTSTAPSPKASFVLLLEPGSYQVEQVIRVAYLKKDGDPKIAADWQTVEHKVPDEPPRRILLPQKHPNQALPLIRVVMQVSGQNVQSEQRSWDILRTSDRLNLEISKPNAPIQTASESAPPADQATPAPEAQTAPESVPPPDQAKPTSKAQTTPESVPPPDQAKPTPKTVRALRFSLGSLPDASRKVLRPGRPMRIDLSRVNGKPATLKARIDKQQALVVSRAEPFEETDKVAFTLDLPYLHPKQLQIKASDMLRHQLLPLTDLQVVHSLVIEAKDATGKQISNARFRIDVSGNEPVDVMPNSAGRANYKLPPGHHTVQWSFVGNDLYEATDPQTVRFDPTVPSAHVVKPVFKTTHFQTVLRMQVVSAKTDEPVSGASVEISWNQGIDLVFLREDPQAAGWYSSGPKPFAVDSDSRFIYTVQARNYTTLTSSQPLAFKPNQQQLKVSIEPDLVMSQVEVTVIHVENGERKQTKNAKVWIIYQDYQGSQKRVALRYNNGVYYTDLAYQLGTQPQVRVEAGAQFDVFEGPLERERIEVELKYIKPFLYVYINPNDQFIRGAIKKQPAYNFGRFKDKFLYLVETLNTQEHWTDFFGKIFIYSVNKNQPPTPLLEPGGIKPNWRERAFQQSILDRIQLGNSFVPYEDVIRFTTHSLEGHHFAPERSINAVFLYILGAPPKPIFDPDDELWPLESLLRDHKLFGVIAQFADTGSEQRQNLTTNTQRFHNLRLLEMDVDTEFNLAFFLGSMQHIEETLSQLLGSRLTNKKG